MKHPMHIVEAIKNAISAVDQDIAERVKVKKTHGDLDRMKKELTEMKNGERLSCSDGMSYIVIDSMNWGQPCLKKFNDVFSLLRKHYRLRP